MPYIFHIYFLDMFHCHPCIFPCVFLNLWSQEKISPYRKTTFIFFYIDFIPFIFLLTILWFFIKINDLFNKIGPIWAHMWPCGALRWGAHKVSHLFLFFGLALRSCFPSFYPGFDYVGTFALQLRCSERKIPTSNVLCGLSSWSSRSRCP